MGADIGDAKEVERLYEYGERLNEAKDKAQHISDYEGILNAVKSGSTKAKQLAGQLIPRFFKFFPELDKQAISAQFDLVEEEELAVVGDNNGGSRLWTKVVGIRHWRWQGSTVATDSRQQRVRVQAIRGLPLLCKDNPDHVSKIVDVLGQLLACEENVERDAVHKAVLTLLRQDVNASLTALFKHVEIGMENIREKVIAFLKDKVFPLKAELLKPQVEMERRVTDLVKKSLQDVTGAEFKMFVDFLKSFSIFGEKAPPERIQELIEIIEGQADLDAQFNVSDVDHIDRMISCTFMALPIFVRGASSSRFLNYFNKHIIPVFDKLPEERRLDFLKSLAGSSPYATAQDSRQLLPVIVQLLKNYMPRRKTEETNFNYVECLLYTFHHLSHKTPNSTNSLCGFKIVTGQPSDRLGEDFSDIYKDFTERLNAIEEIVRVAMKKLTQGMADHNKAISAAKTEDEKAKIKAEQQKATTALRVCNNILIMTQPLHAKSPSFIGDGKITPSWKEQKKVAPTATAGAKRSGGPSNGMGLSNPNKMARSGGGMQNQLVNRALEGLSHGGRNSGRGRGFGGRGRGRGYR